MILGEKRMKKGGIKRSPRNEIKRRVIGFLGINIFIICLFIVINFILRLMLRTQLDSLYCAQLFVLIMVLSSTTFRSLHEENLFRKNKKVYMSLIISCRMVTLASILLYVFGEYKILKEGNEMIVGIRAIYIFIFLYLTIFILGLLIQIGDGI